MLGHTHKGHSHHAGITTTHTNEAVGLGTKIQAPSNDKLDHGYCEGVSSNRVHQLVVLTHDPHHKLNAVAATVWNGHSNAVRILAQQDAIRLIEGGGCAIDGRGTPSQVHSDVWYGALAVYSSYSNLVDDIEVFIDVLVVGIDWHSPIRDEVEVDIITTMDLVTKCWLDGSKQVC